MRSIRMMVAGRPSRMTVTNDLISHISQCKTKRAFQSDVSGGRENDAHTHRMYESVNWHDIKAR